MGFDNVGLLVPMGINCRRYTVFTTVHIVIKIDRNCKLPLEHSLNVSLLWRCRRAVEGSDTWSPCRRSCPRCTELATGQGWCGTSEDWLGPTGLSPTSSVPVTPGMSCDRCRTRGLLHQRWSTEHITTKYHQRRQRWNQTELNTWNCCNIINNLHTLITDRRHVQITQTHIFLQI